MTWFVIKWAAGIFTVWFLNGLRKVWKNPRFKITDVKQYSSGLFTGNSKEHDAIRVEVNEQDYLPPFAKHRETYIKIVRNNVYERDYWVRLSDGKILIETLQDLLTRQHNLYVQEQKYVDHLGTINNDNP